METIDGLLEFIAVAENNGFSSAAKALKVSKSHISKQVLKLENNLQVRLLNRSTRQVTLTDSGQLLFDKSKHIFNDLNEIFSEVTQIQTELSGPLKISVAGVFAEEYLSKAFSSFIKDNPKVSIELCFSERFVDLIGEGYDLAFRYGKLTNSSLISKKIAVRQEYICASPEYLQRYGKPKLPEDLKNHNCLIGHHNNWKFHIKGKPKTIKVLGNMKSNNGRSLVTAGLNGLGIIKLPGAYVMQAIQQEKLIPLLESYTQKEQDIWVVYPQKKHLPQKVRALIDYLTSYLEEECQGIDF